jgi:hypothetical protein
MPRYPFSLYCARLPVVFVFSLRHPGVALKHVKGGAPHPRFVYLAADETRLCWVEDKMKRKDVKEIVLASVSEIFKGFCTPVFKGKYAVGMFTRILFLSSSFPLVSYVIRLSKMFFKIYGCFR